MKQSYIIFRALAIIFCIIVALSYVKIGSVAVSLSGDNIHIDNIYIKHVAHTWEEFENGDTNTINVPIFSIVDFELIRSEDSGYFYGECNGNSQRLNLFGSDEIVYWRPVVTPWYAWAGLVVAIIALFVILYLLFKKINFIGRIPDIYWIVLTALTSRLYWMKYFPDVFYNLEDTYSYEDFFSSPGFYLDFRTPLYPIINYIPRLLLGGVDQARIFVVILQSVIGLISVVILYRILKDLGHKSLANIFTVMFANLPWIIYFEHTIMTENISMFLFLLLVRLIQKYVNDDATEVKKWRLFLFTGIIAVVVTLCIMQRPSFIYLIPLLIGFYVLYGIFEKKILKALVSVLSMAIPIIVVLMVCYLNKINMGRFEISFVPTIYNDGYTLENSNIYFGTDELEIEEDVTAAKYEYGNNQWAYILPMLDKYGYTEYGNFIKQAKRRNIRDFVNVVVNKFMSSYGDSLAKNDISSGRCAERNANPVKVISSGLWCETIINWIFMPLNFAQAIMISIGCLAFGIYRWISRKEINWFMMGISVIILITILLSYWSGFNDFQRLAITCIPALFILIQAFIGKMRKGQD